MAGSYGSSIFYTGSTNLHSCQQYTNVPFSPHPYQHFLFLLFLTALIWTGMNWYLTVVLIYISLMISDVSIFSSSCCPSKENVYLDPLLIFKNLGYLFAIELYDGGVNSLYILDINPYQIYNLQNFLPFSSLFFHFVGSVSYSYFKLTIIPHFKWPVRKVERKQDQEQNNS